MLVDGAKRDRTVWPGDLGIAVPTAYVSIGRPGIDPQRAVHACTARRPRTARSRTSGPAFNLNGSDTYHTWTLLGTSMYYTYSADRAWLDSMWSNYTRGMHFITTRSTPTTCST